MSSTNDISITQFYSDFMEEVNLAAGSQTAEWAKDDFFTVVALEYLSDAGEIDDAIICPYRDRGLQLNAYTISDDYETVELFVSIFNDSDSVQSMARTEIDAALKRALSLYRKAINDLYTSFEKDTDTYGFSIGLSQHRREIKSLKIVAITNGIVKSIPLKNIDIEGAEVSFSIWDIDRIYRCLTSGKMRETVEVDFVELFGKPVPCIENTSNDVYSVYLAILDGTMLAQLYETHGARLLERNVRSFLQVKGAVNKGIRDTLRDEPEMFLAYNNGISVTAETVEIIRDENGRPSIKRIRDMQIVNGGQTTASIYNAKRDKKMDVDLSKVFVQMKLSVIQSPEAMNDIVPLISAYANTQNKVQIADFSANDPFHRKIEELSRVIWAPAQSGLKPKNWFYERARGQYSDQLSRESTPLRKKQFKEDHPCFTKTDLAKYENTWDQLPYVVSEGAQKNFKKFTLRFQDRKGFVPDETYYKRLIAKAILFKRTEKLVQSQNYGGYRANIVTYTIAYISFKSAQRVDLERIWKDQSLTRFLEDEIIRVSALVHRLITNPPGGANIGEWCKKEKCWEAVRASDFDISDDLKSELLSVARPDYVVSTKSQSQGISEITTAEAETIDSVAGVPASTWFALSRWSKETDNFEGWQRSIVFSVGTLLGRGKKPSFKQANQAWNVYNQAIKKGFTG
ncbi:AIPR family protein [Eubacteriales bacterium OttesenSCG-928-G02]|nr:AIPR family protein [Eubacteriales bacterium OttesenSCG-928-G02]